MKSFIPLISNRMRLQSLAIAKSKAPENEVIKLGALCECNRAIITGKTIGVINRDNSQ